MHLKSPKPDSKLPLIGRSIFSVMSGLANETGALNLSQGFPDFNPDPKLLEAANRAMLGGKNQYAPYHGIERLRKNISSLANNLYSADYDPETEITVTSGGTEALLCSIRFQLKEIWMVARSF